MDLAQCTRPSRGINRGGRRILLHSLAIQLLPHPHLLHNRCSRSRHFSVRLSADSCFKARWFLATLVSAVMGLVVASAILSVPLIWLVLSTARGPLPPVASALAIAAFGAAGGLISGTILGCGQFLAPDPRYAWTRSWVVPCALSFGLAGLIFALLYTGSLFLLPPTVPQPLAVLLPAPLAAFASGAAVGAITRTRLEFSGPSTAVLPKAQF